MNTSNRSIDGHNVFSDSVLAEQNRVLGLIDRDDNSKTYGSMDRVHWAWKFTDFPGARFQEGLCYLAFLYTTELNGNLIFGNETARQWLQGGISNWAGIQSRSGDFDEAYPGERSLAATAFTGFYLSEAFIMLESHLDADVASTFKQTLDKAADWLCRNDESHGFLSNHLAAAAAALLHAHRILGKEEYYDRYRYFLDKILDHQSDEGWYEEYGGADPGYQTHGMFYLARCLELSNDERLRNSLYRACEFMKHFVHPDLSLGGEYASRNTQTYYPAAFEMLSSQNGAASWIASKMRSSVRGGHAAGLISVDAYNYFPLLNNYVFALRGILERGEDSLADPNPPPSGPYDKHFPAAGLIRIRRDHYDLIVGSSKGGVVKVFDRRRKILVFSSSGYIGQEANGKQCSSQVFDTGIVASVTDKEIQLKTRFFGFSRPVMTPFKFLLFRIFSLTTGQFSLIATWLKRLLVKVLIYRKNELDLELERRIRIDADGVEVLDRIQGSHLQRLVSLQHKSIFTTIHMGSSRYFTPNELQVPVEIERMEFAGGSAPSVVEFRSMVDVSGSVAQ